MSVLTPFVSFLSPIWRTNKQTNKKQHNKKKIWAFNWTSRWLGIKTGKLAQWITGYDRDLAMFLYYVQGYQRDFTVGVVGTPLGKCVHNLKSTDEHPQVVHDYIEKELQAGRIGGRLLQPPFSKYQMSPFGRERQGKLGLFTICHTRRYRCER